MLARAGEWKSRRDIIRGVRLSIEEGDFDDDEPEVVDIASVPPERLKPIPGASAKLGHEKGERIQKAVVVPLRR